MAYAVSGSPLNMGRNSELSLSMLWVDGLAGHVDVKEGLAQTHVSSTDKLTKGSLSYYAEVTGDGALLLTK